MLNSLTTQPCRPWSQYLVWCVIMCTVTTCCCTYSTELQRAVHDNRVKIRQLDSSVQPREIERNPLGDVLDIFCYKALRRPSLGDVWKSAYFQVSPKRLKMDYQLYVGNNESDVYRKYTEATQASWLNLIGLLPSAWQPVYDTVTVTPFNKTCIGVDISVSYLVHFRIVSVNYILVLRLLLGLLLFFAARRLCKNIVFYYSTGISLGMVASALILVFVLSRFMPKKAGAGALLIGGWSLALYLLQYVWENVQVLLKEYKLYVLIYLATTALVSFAVLYYRGPITNPRALNLVQWTMQLVGLALVYSGTQIPEVSITLVLVLVVLKNVPLFLLRKVKHMWQRRFPPKIELLTEEEYIRQGELETQKALDDLREYCRSPDCNAWKTLSRVQSPSRLAQFVEGDPHLTGDEVEEHFANPSPRMVRHDEEDMDTTF